MIDDDRLLLPSNTARRFPYKFVTRYCPCGKLYSLQLDAKDGRFISAATHLNSVVSHMAIVGTCPQCGRAIDADWLAGCAEKEPETETDTVEDEPWWLK